MRQILLENFSPYVLLHAGYSDCVFSFMSIIINGDSEDSTRVFVRFVRVYNVYHTQHFKITKYHLFHHNSSSTQLRKCQICVCS